MTTAPSLNGALPPSLHVELNGAVAVLRLHRAAKRNALDDATVLGIEAFFAAPPAEVRAVVLEADGDHFSAGLDMGELADRDAFAAMEHSRMWHRAFERVARGGLPVVAVLKGAVVGGGLELASAAHVRVAERSAFYALPEGQRGLFVGGGAAVRVQRLIGTALMTDMMLTGRVLDAEEGRGAGHATYLVDEGAGLATALGLAERIAANSSVTNFAVLQALPRIAEIGPDEGFFMEALMAAVASSGTEAQERMQAFLAGRGAKVRPS